MNRCMSSVCLEVPVLRKMCCRWVLAVVSPIPSTSAASLTLRSWRHREQHAHFASGQTIELRKGLTVERWRDKWVLHTFHSVVVVVILFIYDAEYYFIRRGGVSRWATPQATSARTISATLNRVPTLQPTDSMSSSGYLLYASTPCPILTGIPVSDPIPRFATRSDRATSAHCWATDTDDATVQPRSGAIGEREDRRRGAARFQGLMPGAHPYGGPEYQWTSLKAGKQLGDQTYKVHLDGYDQMNLLTGKGPSKRHEIWYFAESRARRASPRRLQVSLHRSAGGLAGAEGRDQHADPDQYQAGSFRAYPDHGSAHGSADLHERLSGARILAVRLRPAEGRENWRRRPSSFHRCRKGRPSTLRR